MSGKYYDSVFQMVSSAGSFPRHRKMGMNKGINNHVKYGKQWV